MEGREIVRCGLDTCGLGLGRAGEGVRGWFCRMVRPAGNLRASHIWAQLRKRKRVWVGSRGVVVCVEEGSEGWDSKVKTAMPVFGVGAWWGMNWFRATEWFWGFPPWRFRSGVLSVSVGRIGGGCGGFLVVGG